MDGTHEQDSSRAFWAGLVFWIVLCFLAVALRGVRWEESFERAQVLLDTTPYPDGHPHRRWSWNGFSIHYYLSALVLWLTDSPVLLCGGRQFLATLATHLPIYGATWLLTRRVAPAHLAMVLSFFAAISFFQSYMPISAWATKATSGIIGMGWAFAVLLALASSRWRVAGLLFGLMPLIHLGQWPMILVVTVATMLWLAYCRDLPALRCFGKFAASGLACCIVFALAQRAFLLPQITGGAYFSDSDGQAIWAAYTTYEDMHRALTDWPRFGRLGNSYMALFGLLLLTWPLALGIGCRDENRWSWRLMVAYAAFAATAVWVARAIHYLTGTDIPYVVVSWMPYRLIIHVAMLLLCMVCARATLRGGQITLAALAALAWLAFLPLWPHLLPEHLASRYFSTPETALFILAGSMIPGLWVDFADHPSWRKAWALLLLAGGVALACYHQWATLTFAGGVALALVDMRLRPTLNLPRNLTTATALALAMVGLATNLFGEWQRREFLPVSPFEAEMADYLAANSPPEAMVLTPLDEHYQMALKRPVVATFETRQFISYMTSLAPTIDKLFAELYGVRDGHWYDWDLWQQRSEAEWQALGNAWGFRYVLAKSFHPLKLPVCLQGDGLILYEIPTDQDGGPKGLEESPGTVQ